MVQKVFVFGTLKRGFPLHDTVLSDSTFLGDYKTRQPYPMVVAGPWFAPMMFDEPGEGLQVIGELYEVGDGILAALDRLESISEPGNLRVPIEIKSIEGTSRHFAHAYMKTRALARPMHTGYLPAYHDRRFVPFDQRPRVDN